MVDMQFKPKYTVLYIVIVAVAVLVLAALFYYQYTGDIAGDMYGMLSLGIVILAVLGVIATFLKYIAITYRVTDREVVVTEGIVTKTTRVVPVHKIDNISVKRDISDMILTTGSIHIDTPAGGGAVEIVMKRVDAAKLDEVGDAIRKLMRKEQPKAEPAPAPAREPEPVAEEAPAVEKPAKKKGKKRAKASPPAEEG